jgi:hypothetical protein
MSGNPWDEEEKDKYKNFRPKEDEPWYEDFAEGVGVSGLDLWYGGKDLAAMAGLGDGQTDEDKANLADWRKDAGESGWGTGGQVAGEIAQLALPVSKLSKIPKLVNMAKAAPKTLDAIKAVSLAGIRDPGEDGRLERMATEGVLSGAGALAGRAGSKIFRGANKSDEATRVMDSGGYLTPAQASSGGPLTAIENLMSYFPSTGKGTLALRQKASDEYSERALKTFAPDPSGVTKTGHEAIDQVHNQIQDGYKRGFATGNLDNADDLIADIDDIADLYGRTDSRMFEGIADDVADLADNGNKDALNILDVKIGKLLTSNKSKSTQYADLKYIRGLLRGNLTEAGEAQVKAMDDIWPDYLATQRAGKNAHLNQGNFNPAQHSSASSVTGGAAAGRGSMPSRQVIDDGLETVGGELLAPPLSRTLRMLQKIPSPTDTMEFLGQRVLGNSPTQRAGRAVMDFPMSRVLDPGKVAPSSGLVFDEVMRKEEPSGDDPWSMGSGTIGSLN